MALVGRFFPLCALLCAVGAVPSLAQEQPNKEPGPQLAPLPAQPTPAVLDVPLMPEEIILIPQDRPPAETRGRALPPFKLKLAPAEITPLLPSPGPGLLGPSESLASQLRVRVKSFRFEGHRVFSDRDLQRVVAPFVDRDLTSADIEEARLAVTLHYVQAGYINSGALLPDQDLKDGVLVFKVVEGRLTKIEIDGHWWLRAWWLRHELRRSARDPLNFNELKRGLQFLRQNPNLAQINGELVPGGVPGESILKVSVKENQPFRLGVEVSNRRPPSVGSEIVEVSFADLNLTGHSDPLRLRWGAWHTDAEAADRWVYGEFENVEGSYRFPITPWRTTLEVHASRNDSSIVEEQFRLLDITSESEQLGVTLRQPWHASVNTEFATSITADWRRSESFLLGRPFSLSAGAVDGRTQIFVLRVAFEYTNRSQDHVLALRSTFNFGLDAFDATLASDSVGTGGVGTGAGAGEARRKIPDGKFFSWLGQGQYVRRLFDTDNLIVLRLNVQIATDPLLSLEQFSLGGMNSVRGYRENQLLRDNGVAASLEFRIPVWKDEQKNKEYLTLVPFVDLGVGWDRVEFAGQKPAGHIEDRQETLVSAGLGVIFTPWKYVTATLFWGYAFNRDHVFEDGENLQDYGLHFAVSVNAF
jgi:hemolysin activation/secretion protein